MSHPEHITQSPSQHASLPLTCPVGSHDGHPRVQIHTQVHIPVQHLVWAVAKGDHRELEDRGRELANILKLQTDNSFTLDLGVGRVAQEQRCVFL